MPRTLGVEREVVGHEPHSKFGTGSWAGRPGVSMSRRKLASATHVRQLQRHVRAPGATLQVNAMSRLTGWALFSARRARADTALTGHGCRASEAAYPGRARSALPPARPRPPASGRWKAFCHSAARPGVCHHETAGLPPRTTAVGPSGRPQATCPDRRDPQEPPSRSNVVLSPSSHPVPRLRRRPGLPQLARRVGRPDGAFRVRGHYHAA
jgi:hypothetical protein